ncbi:MAG: hypothetical protein GY820_06150, partial [Gammaproteobacteria bacterium]|nr:hypothetical protein [Gammaproteobacteria bacterium]
LQGSVLEHRIFEDDFRVKSISTSKLFGLAHSRQIPVMTVDSGNIGTVLPELNVAENIRDDIADAVNQGFAVRIPKYEITYENWTGRGYVKENIETGESGWMLGGMIAGGMTAWRFDRWPEYYASRLSDPDSEPSVYDPGTGYHIHKITKSDMQTGTAGKPVGDPLQVIVKDGKGKPVSGVPVTFAVKAGGGVLSLAQPVLTDTHGIASAGLTLGKHTSENPVYVYTQDDNTDAAYPQQTGLNIVNASLPSGVGITTPFIAYGLPGEPSQIIKVSGDGQTGTPLSRASYPLTAYLADEYENPISNADLRFETFRPPNYEDYNITPGLVKNGELCLRLIPTYEQCSPAAVVSEKTDRRGVSVYYMFGDRSYTDYSVRVTYKTGSAAL